MMYISLLPINKTKLGSMDITQLYLFPVFCSQFSLCKTKYKVYITHKAETSGEMDANILIEL